jgi:threonine synthase
MHRRPRALTMTRSLAVAGRRGIIARYFAHLPVSEKTPIVTLDEGDTPLLYSEVLSRETNCHVWLKLEGLNPTGSFKDRGMTVAISKAKEEGASVVICASTGNTSASAAAYAARAGMTCAVLVPKGNVAAGKLAQTMVHGARVLEIDDGFDAALELTKQIAASRAVTLVNSVNPHRIEGQKTAAFEIVQALNGPPDAHVMPVGNAGNITALWRGYKESRDGGWTTSLPRMFGVQASGADPIVRGRQVKRPQTIATAIQIGKPASWSGATQAATESGGAIVSVGDDEILDAYLHLAREGIFAEPASAAGVAGLGHLVERGDVPTGATVACVLTGHGLKDPDRAISSVERPVSVRARVEDILERLDLA